MSAAPEPSNPTGSPLRDLVPAALIAAAAVALYAPVLRLWWTDDDFYVLHVLHGRSLARGALSPEVWRQSRMFTPLLLLSFGTDLAAAGPRPGLFYLHQLAAVAAAGVAVYAAVRLWLPRPASVLAALLFLLGAPTGAWAQELLVRHYAEGLVFAAFSTRLFVLSIRRNRPGPALGSALLYLLAALEKEVYVPLPALLLLLPEGDARRRARRLVPHAAAFAGYLAARFAALGAASVGGYGWTVRTSELPGVLARLPARALAASGSGRPLRDGALAIVLALGVAACLRRHGARAAGLLAAALALALAPVLPVSKAFQPRYAGLAWLAVAVAFAFGCSALGASARSRAAALALAALACAAALAVNRGAWAPRLGLAGRMSAEGRAFLELNRGDYLRHPSIPPAAMNELRWWKEEGLALRRGGGWFADDLYLCAHGGSVARLYEYAGTGRGVVVETTAELPALRARYCGGLRDAPLAADFSYSGGDFSWELGPYAAGKWAIVYGDGVERYDVAPHDGYRHHASVFTLRIRYESPEGWVTYSPEIPLDFRASPRLRWERPAARAS